MGWWHPGHRQYRAEIYAARNTLECECCREFRKRPATLAKPNVRRGGEGGETLCSFTPCLALALNFIPTSTLTLTPTLTPTRTLTTPAPHPQTFQPTPRSPSAPPRTCCGLFRRPTPASQTFRDNHDSLGFVRQSGDGARSSASGSGWRTPRGVRKLPEYGVQGSGVSGTSANGREASGAWRRAGGDGGVVRGSGAVGNSGAWRAADRYRYPQVSGVGDCVVCDCVGSGELVRVGWGLWFVVSGRVGPMIWWHPIMSSVLAGHPERGCVGRVSALAAVTCAEGARGAAR